MKLNKKKIELISPAGSMEKIKIAFAYGADAVYAGIPKYSLRVRINDFNEAKLAQAVKYTHDLGKKIYITLNIFAHNKNFKNLPEHIRWLKKLGPDGIFISDPGILRVVKRTWPQAKIILSTQANCTNTESAKFWHEQGVSRVILGREVTIQEIRKIHRALPKLELETFVHGAMCMAYSGRCFISKYFSERSANLGDCAQPCRWQYRTTTRTSDREEEMIVEEDQHGSYILNSQDLCIIRKLPIIISSGVSAIKIEGRAKSVHYLATVVGAYRRALDAIASDQKAAIKDLAFLYKELEIKLVHRGLTEGFMFGQGRKAQNFKNSHQQCQWEFCGQVLRSKKLEVRSKKEIYQVYIKVHNSLKIGDRIEILRPVYDIMNIRINKMWDSESKEEIKEAHGGQGRVVFIESSEIIPKFSVLRRNIK